MNSRVFIGRLAYEATETDVENFLSKFGKVGNIKIKKGYGFAEFEDWRDAEDAIIELDGEPLLGERVSMQYARGPNKGWPGRGRFLVDDRRPPPRTNHRVLISNLSSYTSTQDLKDYLQQEGRVVYLETHEHKIGHGIAEFASYGDMKTTIKNLDGTFFDGKKIKLKQDIDYCYQTSTTRWIKDKEADPNATTSSPKATNGATEASDVPKTSDVATETTTNHKSKPKHYHKSRRSDSSSSSCSPSRRRSWSRLRSRSRSSSDSPPRSSSGSSSRSQSTTPLPDRKATPVKETTPNQHLSTVKLTANEESEANPDHNLPNTDGAETTKALEKNKSTADSFHIKKHKGKSRRKHKWRRSKSSSLTRSSSPPTLKHKSRDWCSRSRSRSSPKHNSSQSRSRSRSSPKHKSRRSWKRSRSSSEQISGSSTETCTSSKSVSRSPPRKKKRSRAKNKHRTRRPLAARLKKREERESRASLASSKRDSGTQTARPPKTRDASTMTTFSRHKTKSRHRRKSRHRSPTTSPSPVPTKHRSRRNRERSRSRSKSSSESSSGSSSGSTSRSLSRSPPRKKKKSRIKTEKAKMSRTRRRKYRNKRCHIKPKPPALQTSSSSTDSSEDC